MNKKVTCAALLITVAIAAPALAEHGFPRHDTLWRQPQAVRLDHRGDRIKAHLDRLDGRIEARLDHRGAPSGRRFDHRAAHRKQRLHEHGHRHHPRSGDYLVLRLGNPGLSWSRCR